MNDIPLLYIGEYSILLGEFIELVNLDGLINTMNRFGVSMKEISDEVTYRAILKNLEFDRQVWLIQLVEKYKQTGEIPECLCFRSL